MTYTFAKLHISKAAWDEIAAKLRAANYGHIFHEIGEETVMDMHGIGLAVDPQTVVKVTTSRKQPRPIARR